MLVAFPLKCKQEMDVHHYHFSSAFAVKQKKRCKDWKGREKVGHYLQMTYIFLGLQVYVDKS